MKVTFYRLTGTGEPQKEAVGVITYENGKLTIPPETQRFVDQIYRREGAETPNEKLLALRMAPIIFRGTYFWAELDE